ncbi:MAG: hypothetical protein AB8G14_08080 [Ilumatobacter sp.]
MPRPLGELERPSDDAIEVRRDLATTRRTSRSFAAAIAVLLLATLVANRSSSALNNTPANAGAVVAAGNIELSDDDGGRSLFDLDALTPVAPVTRCIQVRYSGNILPVVLRMNAEADGNLPTYLDITVEAGTGGDYESCEGFTPRDIAFQGLLADLTDAGWVDVGRFVNTGEQRTFRISLQLQDRSEALGQETSLGFGWEATPA